MAEQRCYRCGRIKPGSKSMEARLKIQTGGDGWGQAEEFDHHAGYIYSHSKSEDVRVFKEDIWHCRVIGKAPAVLCPRCEEEKPC